MIVSSFFLTAAMQAPAYAAARKAALETLNNSLCPRLDVLVRANGSAAKLARKLPRVHVYNWLDDFHEALLLAPTSKGYQDVWSAPKGKGRRREGAVPCSGALCAMLVQASRVVANNCSK